MALESIRKGIRKFRERKFVFKSTYFDYLLLAHKSAVEPQWQLALSKEKPKKENVKKQQYKK